MGRQLRMLAGRPVVYGWSVLAGTITRLSPEVSFITVIGLTQLNPFTSAIPAKPGDSKERTFDSTFVLTLREPRKQPKAGTRRSKKSDSPVHIAKIEPRKPTKASGKGNTTITQQDTALSRTIGGTHEITIELPEPSNSGGRSKNNRKPAATSKPSGKRTTLPSSEHPKPKRAKLTPEEKKKRDRTRMAERRLRRRQLGLCYNCSNPAIEGEIRCQSCKKKHQLSNKRPRNK